MKTLSLCRHAKSSWKYDTDDLYRPLNGRGIANAPAMARSYQGEAPGLILCSPAVRAYATALAYIEENNWPLELLRLDERLFHSGVDAHLAVCASVDDGVEHVFLVGHNPGLEEFGRFLCPDASDCLVTGARLSLWFEVERWCELTGGRAEGWTFVYPKGLQD